jgi:hypothetical protein
MKNSAKSVIVHTSIAVVLVLGMIATGSAAAITISIPADKDNTIYSENAAESNGAGDFFFAGRTNGGELRRALISFPVSDSLPPCATVTDVRLNLNMSRTRSGDQTVDLHLVLADWGEASSDAAGQEGGGAPADIGDATWIFAFFSTVSWDSAGGDYAAPVSASAIVGAPGPYTWAGPQLVTDVQRWVDNPQSNFGWVIIGNEATNQTAKRFDSRTHPTAGNRPVLEVTYEDCASVPHQMDISTWGEIKSLYR